MSKLIAGSGQKLAKEIMNKNYHQGFGQHPWADQRVRMRNPYKEKMKKKDYYSQFGLEAHHIITTKNLESDKWKKYRKLYEYNINTWKNGVMLPYEVDIACQACTHVHRSNHNLGQDLTSNTHPATYIEAVNKLISPIEQRANNNYYCINSNKKKFTQHLNMKSKIILENLDSFKFTISVYGEEYSSESKIGCAGGTNESMSKSRETQCKHREENSITTHGLYNYKNKLIKRKILEVGK